MKNSTKTAFLLLLSASFLLSCGDSKENVSSSSLDVPSSLASSETIRSEESASSESKTSDSSSKKSLSSSSETPSSEKLDSSIEESLSSNDSVSSNEPASEEKSSEDISSEDETTYYVVSFNSMGGSEVPSQRVKEGEKAVEPDAPTKDGYEFQGWYKSKTYAVAFSFDTFITTDYELFAKWGTSSETSSEPMDSSETSSEQMDSFESSSESTDSSTDEDSSHPIDSSEQTVSPHGPEGSTLVGWYICGSGSLWGNNGWGTAGGIQLFSNPTNAEDKGCILDIALSSGDVFKVTDGTSWFGYEKVSQYVATNNKGLTNFTGIDDGCGGQNIKCTVSGTYDIYVNKDGQFWVE